MKFLQLNGTTDVTFVDDDIYECYKDYKWSLDGKGYPKVTVPSLTNRSGYTTLKLHRLITKPKSGEQVDHINGNKLDNRRSNLRLCNNSQNQMNQSKKKGVFRSDYKGVCWKKQQGKWYARIGVNYKRIHLGYFNTEKEAALAYNAAALKYFGEFARLNIIDGV